MVSLCGRLLMLITFVAAAVACDTGTNRTKLSQQAQGITDTEIWIGSSLALSGHAGYLGTQTLRGALAYLNHVNEQGGIHGRQIRLIVHDDGYDPPRCVANTQRLIIEDQVFALFSYVGTPTTVKIIPLVEDARIPLVGMFTGASALREPFKRYIINIRPSYHQETAAAVRRIVLDLSIRKVAVFYQYDAYGFDGLKGTELALKAFGLAPVATGSYVRGTLDIREGLNRIRESGADAVVMIGTYDPCAKFIKEAKGRGFIPLFYSVSSVGPDELAKRVGGYGDGVIVTQVVPSPPPEERRSELWGVMEYTALLNRYYPEDIPNSVGLEGYINARILVEGLERASPAIDRERFINALETIQNHDLGIGNSLSLSPTDHQGFDRVYFTRIRNGKFELLTDWSKVKDELGQKSGPIQPSE